MRGRTFSGFHRGGSPADRHNQRYRFFGNSACNITAAVMLKSPFPVVLSKGWVNSAQPIFTYEDGKLAILPPPPYNQFGRVSPPEGPKTSEEENLIHRGRLLHRHMRPFPDIRNEAPTRHRSIVLLVLRDVVLPPQFVARVSREFPENLCRRNSETWFSNLFSIAATRESLCVQGALN